MKKLFFIFTFLSCFSSYAQKQDSLNAIFPKNTIFVDILGQGGLSWNYDRIFYQKNRFKLSYRTGFGIFPHTYGIDTVTYQGGKIQRSTNYHTDWTRYQFSIPMQINFMYGKSKHFAEIGLGVTTIWGYYPIYNSTERNPVGYRGKIANVYSIQINYRRQGRKGLFFRPGIHLYNYPNWQETLSPNTVYRVLNQFGNSNWFFIISLGIGKSFGK